MTPFRRRSLPTLLAISTALWLAACAAGEPVTGATGGILLTDAQRSSVAQHLLVATQSSGEGAIAATFAAAAIVGGAEVRALPAERVAALAGSEVRGNVVTSATSSYLTVAAQVGVVGSSDQSYIIVAWRNASDGTPSDFVVTLSSVHHSAVFGTPDGSAPSAFGLIYAAPNSWWTATAGTTTLGATSVGAPCRDIDARLAASGYRGTCRLALFDAWVAMSGSKPAAIAGNAAAGSPSFAIPQTQVGGVMFELTPIAAR